MVVIYNLNKKDSIIKRGTIITSINGLSSAEIVSIMFDYMVEDGYSDNVNYIRLSTVFLIFIATFSGFIKTYNVGYIDSNGVEQNTILPYYNLPPDSAGIRKKIENQERKLNKKKRLQNIRSLTFDTSYALMTINSFSKGHLKNFFKRSFRNIRKKKISEFGNRYQGKRWRRY